MITDIKVNNFKSLNFKDPLLLNNINVLCGANSSGKSSLLQTILMLSQTFEGRFNYQTSVSLNGHLVKLGGYDDIKCHSSDENVNISFTVTDQNSTQRLWGIKKVSINFIFGFDHDQKSNNEQLTPPLLNAKIILEYENEISKQKTFEIEISSIHEEPVPESKIDTELIKKFRINNISEWYVQQIKEFYPDVKIIDCTVKNIMIDSIRISYDQGKFRAKRIVDYLINPRRQSLLNEVNQDKISKNIIETMIEYAREDGVKRNQELIKNFNKQRIDNPDLFKFPEEFDIDGFLKNNNENEELIEKIKVTFRDKTEITLSEWSEFTTKNLKYNDRNKLSTIISLYQYKLRAHIAKEIGSVSVYKNITVDILTKANAFLAHKLSQCIKYLGPLRSDPKAIYPITHIFNKFDIGSKGENAAAVYHLNKQEKISYPSPNFNSQTNEITFSQVEANFQQAVSDWLIYLNVVEQIHTEDKGKLGYELKVKTSGNNDFQDLTHVGVGVSQVLPIILLCLLSKPGDILIFEQPELHLHPKIQAKLTDFLIAIASSNRQIILETHSEYIINRLRLRIASSMDEQLKDLTNILFIKKNNQLSNFEKINISKYGSITNWPDDFFDQTQSETEQILISATLKKCRH